MEKSSTTLPYSSYEPNSTELFALQPEDPNPRLVSKYLNSRNSPNSLRTMKVALQHFMRNYFSNIDHLDDVPWEKVNVDVLNHYKRSMQDDEYVYTTINYYLAAIRGVLKVAWHEHIISTEQYMRAIDVPNVSGERVPAGREIEKDEQAKLFAELNKCKKIATERDRAIFAIALNCGLRRNEIISLDREKIDFRKKRLSIIGKGNKERPVSLNSQAIKYLSNYIDSVRGDEPGAMFTRIRKNDDVTDERLTNQSIYFLFGEWSKRSSIERISPHDCRRTVATRLLDQGVPIHEVQILLGHADPKTTKRYDMKVYREQSNIVELLAH